MINDIWLRFLDITIVLLCLLVIIIIIWHNISKKTVPIYLLPSVIGLFILSLWSTVNTTVPTALIVIYALLILLYLLLSILKHSKSNQIPPFDQAQLIQTTQEQERSRIYANLHDDVGAKLLELIYSAQDDKTKSLAKDILSNIRQAVAQTQNIKCTLAELIHSIYNEANLRLNACNIQLHCDNQVHNDEHKFVGLIPNAVERICREVISNIIKHSQATDVKFNFYSQATGFSLKIADNGVGFKDNKKGKGFTTIEKRAKKINARTHWLSEKNKGTQFTLICHYDN